MNHHQRAAISDAAALVTRAATEDHASVWALADEIAQGDHVREALVVLAENAAALLGAIADLRHVPPGAVLEQFAGFHADAITANEDS